MSGDARILIETSPGQSRALHLVDGQVVEAWHDFHHDPDLTGRVYRVRTDRVFPAQNRATATLEDGTAISAYDPSRQAESRRDCNRHPCGRPARG